MMDADRWRRVEAVFAEALEKTPDATDVYLNAVCAGDPSMRSELISLLDAHRKNGSFLEALTRATSQQDDAQGHIPLAAGTRLGAFEIVSPIGSGGMGTVYHARDSRLDRAVALKILSHRLDVLGTSSERFQREARAISRLSHPHICTLYDIARAPIPPDSRDGEFLVMELVRGETLADVIARAPLSLENVVQYAIEMADALAHAHREGIVHRDLKPQNIMITPGGVKLLDFGVAAFTASEAHAMPTWPGISRVAGTVQYMAPEQIRGEDVDGRTDLFSLGLVLHEMLNGRRAFERSTTLETLHAILNEAPPPLPETVPAELRRIVGHCLEKDRQQRMPSAADLAVALRSVTGSVHPLASDVDVTAMRRWWRLASAALWSGAAVLATSLAVAWSWKEPPTLKVTRYVRLTNDGHEKTGGLVTDGTYLYLSELVANEPMLMKVSTSGGDPVPLPIPFRNPGLDDISSRDSELVVGSYVQPYPFPYWRVPVSGGQPRPLGPFRAHDVHPSPDGRRVAYTVNADVFVSGADGSMAQRVATFPGKSAGNMAWAPDGRRLRMNVSDFKAGEWSIWEVSLDDRDVRPVLPGWRKPSAECCGRWTPDGAYFIFESKQNGVTSLWALSESRGYWRRNAGRPVRLTDGPQHFRSPTPATDGRTIFAIRDEVPRRDHTPRSIRGMDALHARLQGPLHGGGQFFPRWPGCVR